MFSIVFLLALIIGKQVFVQYLFQVQKAETQYITFLSRQRILCTQIVKSVYQYRENPDKEHDFFSKVAYWHDVNMSLLHGNSEINIPVPHTTDQYVALYSDVVREEGVFMEGIKLLKGGELEKGVQFVLSTEEPYMATLEKMVQMKGKEAGKNYGIMAMVQMATDILVIITLIGNFLLIMIPFIRLLIQKNMELQTSNEKLESVLESVSDMKFLLGLEGEILLLNKTAKAGIGFFTGKALQIKDNILDLVAPERMGEFSHAFYQALKGNIVIMEKSFEKNNITYWYRVEYHPVWNQEKEITNVALSFTDISDLKNAQVTLETQNKDLQEIAFIQSHELRGPLARIMGLVSLFNNHYPNDNFNQDIIKNIKHSSEKLDEVIFRIVAKAEKIDTTITPSK
jgi:PAS domain S-box-containing protein